MILFQNSCSKSLAFAAASIVVQKLFKTHQGATL